MLSRSSSFVTCLGFLYFAALDEINCCPVTFKCPPHSSIIPSPLLIFLRTSGIVSSLTFSISPTTCFSCVSYKSLSLSHQLMLEENVRPSFFLVVVNVVAQFCRFWLALLHLNLFLSPTTLVRIKTSLISYSFIFTIILFLVAQVSPVMNLSEFSPHVVFFVLCLNLLAFLFVLKIVSLPKYICIICTLRIVVTLID